MDRVLLLVEGLYVALVHTFVVGVDCEFSGVVRYAVSDATAPRSVFPAEHYLLLFQLLLCLLEYRFALDY